MFSNYTFSDLKDDLTGLVGGTDLAKITNLNQLVRRAAQRVNGRLDLKTTARKHLLTIFNGVFDYSVPSDDDFKRAFDLRPQVLRSQLDNFSERFTERFDLKKELEDAIVSTEWQDGTQFFRISRKVNSRTIVLDSFETTTGWTAHGDAENLTSDTITKAKGSASLNFDLDGSGTTGGASKTITSVDLSDHDELSSLFVWFYFPDASAITSVRLRWGNSASVYWQRQVTTPHFGSAFVNGWNLLRFDWNGATETGTVDPSVIDFLYFDITYDGTADTDFRVDDATSKLGVIYELWYYSRFMFRTSGGSWQDTIANNTDIINLDHDLRNILVYECEDEIGKQLRDDDMKDDAREELFGVPGKIGLYDKYKADNPSEAFKKRGVYYRI